MVQILSGPRGDRPSKRLHRRFAVVRWKRFESWFVVKSLLRLALSLLLVTRRLHAQGLISDRLAEHAIRTAGMLNRRGNTVWRAYCVERQILKNDMLRTLADRSPRRRR